MCPSECWPIEISEAFQSVFGGIDTCTDESEFYAPYNAMLSELFPLKENFLVSPQYKRPPAGWSIDFTTVFVVQRQRHPVFFLEIKPPSHLKHIAERGAADAQMRDRFAVLADAVNVPILHGVSALGTNLAFYTYEASNGNISPQGIPQDPSRVNDIAPSERWNTRLFSETGHSKLSTIATDIKEMVRIL